MRFIETSVLLLFFVFSGFAVWAQPAVGQKYLTLRHLNFSVQNNVDEQLLGPVSTTFTNLNFHIQGSKMVSDNRSIGMGLISGINRRAPENGGLQQRLSIGASGFIRQWFAVRKQFYLHLDLQASTSYSGGFASEKSFYVDFALIPGISWFFHPKWSLEGRLAGLNLNYRSETTFFTQSRGVNMGYNVNPLNMQFAVSRFF